MLEAGFELWPLSLQSLQTKSLPPLASLGAGAVAISTFVDPDEMSLALPRHHKVPIYRTQATSKRAFQKEAQKYLWACPAAFHF